MPIEPFQIVNQDGTINQVEYQRCIEFLEQFVQGLIPVYASMTWNNPFEVDLTQQHSSLYILRDIMTNPTNRLLTKSATDHIVNLFKATVSGLSRPFIMSYEQIKSSGDWGLPDSPGYCFDEALQDYDHQVYFEDCVPEYTDDSKEYDIHVAWKNDEYHSTISLGHRHRQSYSDASSYNAFPSPTQRLEYLSSDYILHDLRIASGTYGELDNNCLLFLWTNPNGYYNKSSGILYWLSECKDPLYRNTGNWYDSRIQTQVNVRTGGNLTQFGLGVPFDELLQAKQSNNSTRNTMFWQYQEYLGKAYLDHPSNVSEFLMYKLYRGLQE